MTLDTCVELTALRLLRGPEDAAGSAAAVKDHVAGCPRCAGAVPVVDAALAELAAPPAEGLAESAAASSAEARLVLRLGAPTLRCAACAREVARTRVRGCPACLAAYHPDCAPGRARCARCQARLTPWRRPSLLPFVAGGVGGLLVAAAAWGGAGFPDLRRSGTAELAATTAEVSRELDQERRVVLGRAALAAGDARAALDAAQAVLGELPGTGSWSLRQVRSDATALLVRATLRAGPVDVAGRESLERLVEGAWRSPRTSLAQAELALAGNRVTDAFASYVDAAQLLPAGDVEQVEALLGQLRTGVTTERWAEALAAASALKGRDEHALEVACAVAVAHAARGEEPEAELHGAEAARLGQERGDWRGPLALADARFRVGRRWAARDALADAQGVGAATPARDVARGDVLLAAGALSEALGAAEQALSRAPDDLAARALRADALLELLDVEQACEEAERVRASLEAPPAAWARAMRVLARVTHLRDDEDPAASSLAAKAQRACWTVQGQLLLATLEVEPDLSKASSSPPGYELRDVLDVRPRSLEGLRALVRARLAQLGFDGFHERLLDDLLAVDPRDPLALSVKARLERGRGKNDAARALTVAAARAARDPRRPEGRAFALGVLAERVGPGGARDPLGLSRDPRLAGAAQPRAAGEGFAAALAADPLHVQALVAAGLRALADDAAGASRARALWRRAAPHVPDVEAFAPGSWLLEEQLDAPPAFVVAAAELSARGQTEGPRLLHLDLAATRFKQASRVDTASDWVVAAKELDRQRGWAPWDVTSFVLEATAIRHALAAPLAPDLAERLVTRLATIEAERARRVEERERRALADRRQGQASPLARVQAAPWLAAPWAALADERAQAGDAWGALGAHARAASLDPGRTAGLAARLQAAADAARAGRAAPDLEALDRSLAAPDPALAELLRGAAFVAEALARRPEKGPAARARVDALEELALCDPRSTAPQLLLGVLHLAVGLHERAVEHLLFVGFAASSGEAFYLAAAAAATDPDATPAGLERAVEWLHCAAGLGHPVARALASDARFSGLQASLLAAYLPRE